MKHLKLEGRGHMPSKNEVSDIWNFVKEYSLDGVAEPIVVPSNRDTVFNGSFSDSLKLAGWKLQNHSGEGSLKFSDGKAEINVASAGTNAYDIQMIQNGMHYENGESYKLSFEASASVARTLEVNLEKDTDPWTSYLGEAKTFDITTDKKTFEVLFTMNEPTDENGRISFNAGLATGSVFIDNVILTKGDKSNLDPINSENTTSIVVNVIPKNSKTFVVYNINGSFVCELSVADISDIQSQLNSKSLNKGLYVVKNGNFNRIYSIK